MDSVQVYFFLRGGIPLFTKGVAGRRKGIASHEYCNTVYLLGGSS